MEKHDIGPESNCPFWVQRLSGATLTGFVVIGCCAAWVSAIGMALL